MWVVTDVAPLTITAGVATTMTLSGDVVDTDFAGFTTGLCGDLGLSDRLAVTSGTVVHTFPSYGSYKMCLLQTGFSEWGQQNTASSSWTEPILVAASCSVQTGCTLANSDDGFACVDGAAPGTNNELFCVTPNPGYYEAFSGVVAACEPQANCVTSDTNATCVDSLDSLESDSTLDDYACSVAAPGFYLNAGVIMDCVAQVNCGSSDAGTPCVDGAGTAVGGANEEACTAGGAADGYYVDADGIVTDCTPQVNCGASNATAPCVDGALPDAGDANNEQACDTPEPGFEVVAGVVQVDSTRAANLEVERAFCGSMLAETFRSFVETGQRASCSVESFDAFIGYRYGDTDGLLSASTAGSADDCTTSCCADESCSACSWHSNTTCLLYNRFSYFEVDDAGWISNLLQLPGKCVWVDGTGSTRMVTAGETFGTTIGDLMGHLDDGICAHTALSRLEMGGQKISGSIPPCLLQYEGLQYASLYRNYLSGTLPTLARSSPLFLDIDVNDVSGTIPDDTSFTMSAHGNQLTGFLPAHFNEFGSLYNNQISGTIPEDMAYEGSLLLHNNRLSGKFPASFFSGPGSLTFYDAPGIGGKPIAPSVASNFISGYAPEEWTCNFNMENNQISGTLPESLLCDCDVRANNNFITGTIPNGEGDCIGGLRVANNLLSGSLPARIFSGNTVHIDLSGNDLTGTVGALSIATKQFEIARNRISGPMPVILGSSALEILDISGNRFTGTIPSDCANSLLDTFFGVAAITCYDNNGLSCAANLTDFRASDNLFTSVPDYEVLVYASITGETTAARFCPSDCNPELTTVLLDGNPFEGTFESAILKLMCLQKLDTVDFSRTGLHGSVELPDMDSEVCAECDEYDVCVGNPCVSDLEHHVPLLLNAEKILTASNQHTGRLGEGFPPNMQLDVSGNVGITGRLPEEYAVLKSLDASGTSIAYGSLPTFLTRNGVSVPLDDTKMSCEGLVEVDFIIDQYYDGYARCTCAAGSRGMPPDCTVCPSGTYSGVGATNCTACPTGQVASAGSSGCTSCLAGTAPSNTSDVCESCPRGMFSGFEAEKCANCPDGSIADTPQSCFKCPAGEYAADPSTCRPCPVGNVSKNEGSAKCESCGEGEEPSVTRDACLLCPLGSFSGEGDVECTPCPSGQVSMRQGSSNCSNCSLGEIPTAARDRCDECQPGSSAGPGHTDCTPCPAGQSTNTGKPGCNACLRGQYSVSGGTCTPCEDEFYSVDPAQVCVRCPSGALCIGGMAKAAAGYWQDPASGEFVQCASEAACPGGDTSCAEGHNNTSPFCSQCVRANATYKFSMVGTDCSKCWDDTFSYLLIVLMILFAVAYVAYSTFDAFNTPNVSKITLKILVSHLHQVALIVGAASFARSYFANMLGWSSSTSPSLNSFPVACVADPEFKTVLGASLILPITVAGLAFIVGGILSQALSGKKAGVAMDIAFIVVVQFCFIAQPSLTKGVLEGFDCTSKTATGVTLLKADTRVECWVASYTPILIMALIGMALYVIGIPLFFFGLLRHSKDNLHDPRVERRLQFLYFGYRPEVWYYEVLVILRKSILAAILVFAHAATTQIGVMAFILIAAVGIHHVLLPFETTLLNHLEFFSFFLNIASIAVSLMFFAEESGEEGEDSTLAGVFSVICGLAQLVYVVYLILITMGNHELLQKRLPESLANALHVPLADEESEAFDDSEMYANEHTTPEGVALSKVEHGQWHANGNSTD